MTDPMERMLDNRDELDRATQAFERAGQGRGPVEGSDPTGQVTVSVSPEGHLKAVRIRAGWEQSLTAGELGPATMSAMADAGTQSALEWGTALSDALDGPTPTTRPLPSFGDSIAAGLDEVTTTATLVENDRASLEAMVEMLEGMLGEIDTVSDEVEAVTSRTFTGHAGGADVTVTVTGAGTISGVLVAEAAARHHAANISRYIMAAYDDALRQVAATGGIDQILERSVFGELSRLSADPRALTNRFGVL